MSAGWLAGASVTGGLSPRPMLAMHQSLTGSTKSSGHRHPAADHTLPLARRRRGRAVPGTWSITSSGSVTISSVKPGARGYFPGLRTDPRCRDGPFPRSVDGGNDEFPEFCPNRRATP
jgi:hypothetical protein